MLKTHACLCLEPIAPLVYNEQVLARQSVLDIGMWPSGKAPGFGPGIRGFESLHPSHFQEIYLYLFHSIDKHLS